MRVSAHDRDPGPKATFITLAIEDGARPEIIRDRVTHAKIRRSAFDGYDRGSHRIETCGEVAKLQITPARAGGGGRGACYSPSRSPTWSTSAPTQSTLASSLP